MRLSERVATFIEQEALLEPGQGLVVGVSGGPDSVCLLDCLIRLDYQPIVAHFDHQLREESAEEAEAVLQLARSYGVPFELGYEPPVEDRHSVEEAARISRYRFLAGVARQRGMGRVAVGHTANDQAETVLMHLIRGAGPSGLRGMQPITDLREWVGVAEEESTSLVRPLLEVWRRETEEYCAEHELPTLSDPSNWDTRFFRNRLRHELLPELQTYNPRVQEVLLRTAKVMAAEANAIDELVEAHWNDWVTTAGEGTLALQTGEFLQAPLALQRAAIRRVILQLVPDTRDVGFDTVERALRSIRDGKRLTLPGGLDLLTLNGEAFLRTPGASISLAGVPQVRSKEARALSIPYTVELDAGWRLSGQEMEPKGETPRGADEVWFEASGFDEEIALRTPRPGDRMEPMGMSGSMKLSDLFVNRKVPRPARERWPVITYDEEIIWVPGLHHSRHAKVVPDTRKIVQMRLIIPN